MGLVQGELEDWCEATVTMSGSVAIHLFLARYEKLLRELHIEQKNKIMVGTYHSVAIKEGKEAEPKSRQQKKQQKKKEVRSSDIWDMR